MTPRVVITHWVHREVLELLSRTCDVVPNVTRETLPREEVLRRARDADALMVFMPDVIDRSFIESCRRLRIIAGAFKGYDNIDVGACTDNGVWFTIVPDLLTSATAELAIGILIGLTRNLGPGDGFVRTGDFMGWRPKLYGAGLSGKTVGIVGMGAIGNAIATRLTGFGVTILYADPAQSQQIGNYDAVRVELDDLLERSDHVVLSLPLTETTTHLIDRRRLMRMKKGAYLVNVGRGSVVDEQAVADALLSGRLSGYAADVFEMEDLSRSDRPVAIPESLLKARDRTLFTPHLGSAVTEVRLAIELEAVACIFEALNGERPKSALNDPPKRRLLSPARHRVLSGTTV